METETATTTDWDHCHCGAHMNGSDHCPDCGCEQWERTCDHTHSHSDPIGFCFCPRDEILDALRAAHASHRAFEADNCPRCGTCAQIPQVGR